MSALAFICSRRFWTGPLACLATCSAWGIEFESRLLREGTTLDVGRFARQSGIPEGTVTLDVTVNQQWKGRHAVPLRALPVSGEVRPCYDIAVLRALGLDLVRLPDGVARLLADDATCVRIDELLVPAHEALDFGNLRLDLQIAQAALRRQASDHLPPEQWDHGVTAGFVDYHLNHFEQRDRQLATRQSYLGVRTGLNTGRWYWRHEGNWQAANGIASVYQPTASWVTTDVDRWSAQLTLGEGYTRGQVFTSSAFRGVLLGSDERMLPSALQGFAPTVTGVAHSTALLSIRQRGVLLHESTVAAGPFEVDDLHASGVSDDLEITLREADGTVRTFVQPYQAASLALRPGARRFEVGSGVWRDGVGRTGPGFVQGSWQQGVDNRLSLHGGAWLASDYQSAAAGLAINSRFGAFGLTHYGSRSLAQSKVAVSGRALRLGWHHRVGERGTDLGADFTGSGSGYATFDEYARVALGEERRASRTRLDLRLRQQLGDGNGRFHGAFNSRVSGQGRGRSTGYEVGYSNVLGTLAYGLEIRRELGARGASIDSVTLNASLPLGGRRSGLVRAVSHVDSQGRSTSNLRWSDVGGDQGQWGYGLSAVHQGGVNNNAGVGANLRHSGSAGQVTAALEQRRTGSQFTVGAQGGLVAHAGGWVAAPSLGDSFAIVHAPGAESARVRQQPQVRLDARGFGVVPSLVPYAPNDVDLDPKGMSRDVELQLAGQSVVPRAGSASLLYFPTRTGQVRVIEARQEGGAPLPFGAWAVDSHGNELGMVGQGSRLHVLSSGAREHWKVSWGEASDETCWLWSESKGQAVCTRAPLRSNDAG